MSESHDAGAAPQEREAAPPPPRPQRAVESEEVRVSTIIGDRLCAKCGFNLTGQPIVKESRYELFIARCPECGTVAALQEYPVLGKWANRWASLAAGLWLVILLGGGFVFGMTVFGVSIGCMQVGSNDFADLIAARAAGDATNSGGVYHAIETSWWNAQDPWRLLSEFGGFRKVVASETVGFWFGLFVGGIAFGVIGSVALLHARRLRAAAVMALPIALAAVFQIITHVDTVRTIASNMTISAFEAALATVGPVLLGIADASAYAGILVGVLIGRPLARMLVRAMLPPRMRSTMSYLWLTDGKSPPTSRR